MLSLGGLLLLSTPFVSGYLLGLVSTPPVVPKGGEADAIVILGGGLKDKEVEYGGDTLGSHTIERVRYGAWLARRLGKPVMVSGGRVADDMRTEGSVMRAVLETEYGIPVRWVEERSTNTWENARYSAEMLRKDGIERIYLVSHAWHLKRAVPQFQRAGLRVVAAGTGYPDPGADGAVITDFIPSAKAMLESYLAFHEGIGLIWYRIRGLFRGE
jgi:uncharacterized SAM-binding protein YcdF (DUF218 family)